MARIPAFERNNLRPSARCCAQVDDNRRPLSSMPAQARYDVIILVHLEEFECAAGAILSGGSHALFDIRVAELSREPLF